MEQEKPGRVWAMVTGLLIGLAWGFALGVMVWSPR